MPDMKDNTHTPGPWRISVSVELSDLQKLAELRGTEPPEDWQQYFRSNDGDFSVLTADRQDEMMVAYLEEAGADRRAFARQLRAERDDPAAVRRERDPKTRALRREATPAALKLRQMEDQAQRQPGKDVTDSAGIRLSYTPAGRARTSDGRYHEPFMTYERRLPWGGWTHISREQALALTEGGAA